MGFVLRSPPLSRPAAEALSTALSEEEPSAGAVSVVEVDERQDLWRVDAYYEDEPPLDAFESLKPDAGEFALERLPDIDWVARSLEGLPPVKAGRFIVHGSHHRGQVPPGGVRIEIDAGGAFGTGHHATTLACLEALDKRLKRARPRRCLDIGCGTGVLAIAAARAARAKAEALDVDPQAVRVTCQNARLNGVAGLVRQWPVKGAPARAYARLGRFDLVFANILAGPLVALAPFIAAKLAPGGVLVLSGLTREQEREVRAAYASRGFRMQGRIERGSWSTLVFGAAPVKRGFRSS